MRTRYGLALSAPRTPFRDLCDSFGSPRPAPSYRNILSSFQAATSS
jgi:hypothetical protein